MLWLRALFFASPLTMVLGGVWLFDSVTELRLSDESEALVYAIEKPVGFLNPLVPQTGITREVTELLFEPLLIRDDDLNLRPNLFDSWIFQTVVLVRCAGAEEAGEAEAKLRSGEYLDEDMKMVDVTREENVLTIALEGFDPTLETRLVGNFESENLGKYILIRLSVTNSVRNSFESFLENSVEKSQIAMLEYEGDTTVNMFVRGEIDLFLRELNLYYESNASLDPVIEQIGEQSHTSYREFLVTLRTDVRWHDGMRFSADDVVFSFNELTKPGSPLGYAASFWFVEKLEKLDPYRLRVLCSEAPSTILESWEKLPVIPKHLVQGGIENTDWIEFFRKPVGNGPYRIERRRNDGGIELIANEFFFRGVPMQKSVVYRRFGSLESVLLALRADRIDAIVPDERFTDWSERNPGEIQALRCLPRYQTFVAWNLDREPFDRGQVRTALARAVDLKSVLRDTATGFQTPTKSLFFPGVPYEGEPMNLPVYDPRSAERDLEESEFALDEKKGVRVDEDGEALKFVLTVNEENAEHLRIAAALADQWAGVGVTVVVEPMSWSEILTKKLMERDFDAVMLGWELPFERDRLSAWHSASIGEGGGNICGLRNQIVDEILERLRFESDPEAVRTLTGRLNGEIGGLQPCFFVCDSGRILSLRRGGIGVVRNAETEELNFQPVGIGKAGLHNVRPWWVRIGGEESVLGDPVSPEP